MLARINGLILLWVVGSAAGRDRLDQRIAVRMSEPGDGVAGRDYIGNVGAGMTEDGRFDDAVFGRCEGVIEPAGEEIANCDSHRQFE